MIDAGLPFISAEMDGDSRRIRVLRQWKSRAAYRHTVEDSIYLAPDALGRGIGGRLLDALLTGCADAGFGRSSRSSWTPTQTLRLRCTAIAVSSTLGRLTAVGYKHGRWLDTVLLQRTLTPGGR